MSFNGCISASDKIVLVLHITIYRILAATFFTTVHTLVNIFTCQPKNARGIYKILLGYIHVRT